MATQSVAMGRRTPPASSGHAHASVGMPPGLSPAKGRLHHRHSERRGADHDSHRHSERRGAKRSEAPRIEEPVLQRREATPLLLLRHGVQWPEINVDPPLESMLRLCVRCLVEGLFEGVPPLRAFGPPVGMTVKGGPTGAPGGLCRAGHGVCHRGHRGHRDKPGDSTGLCGLCDSLWLVLPLRAVHPVRGRAACVGWVAWPRKAWPWDDERPPASPGHAHASVAMPPGADGSRRAWACHPALLVGASGGMPPGSGGGMGGNVKS